MENEGRDTPFDVDPRPNMPPPSFSFVFLVFAGKTSVLVELRPHSKTLAAGTLAVFPVF